MDSQFPREAVKGKAGRIHAQDLFRIQSDEGRTDIPVPALQEEKQQQLEEIKYFYQISDRYVGDMELFNGEEIY